MGAVTRKREARPRERRVPYDGDGFGGRMSCISSCSPRDDDCLPGSLEESLTQAAQCTFDFVSDTTTTLSPSQTTASPNVSKCLVEVVLPELFGSMRGNVMARRGDQMRAYDLCRDFVVALQTQFDEAREQAQTSSGIEKDVRILVSSVMWTVHKYQTCCEGFVSIWTNELVLIFADLSLLPCNYFRSVSSQMMVLRRLCHRNGLALALVLVAC